MLFKESITIPANTLKASPTIQLMRIAQGTITRVMVRPRPGHSGLAHCVIRYQEHILFPSTEDMDFAGDTFPIDWDEYEPINQPPYEFKICGWNDDDTYEHTFDIFIAMMPTNISSPFAGIIGSLKSFLRLVGVGG